MEVTTNESNASKESDVCTKHNTTELCMAEDPDSRMGENEVVAGTSAQSCTGEADVVVGTSVEKPSTESDECEDLDPCVGMEFNSEWDAQRFYFDYAENMGFRVRICGRRRSPHTWKTVGVDFVCSREGFRRDGSTSKRRNYRSGCLAMLRIKRTEFRRNMPRKKRKDSRKWVVVKFIKEHNHELGDPPEAPFLHSHGHLVDESGGSDNVFPLQGCRTFIQGLRKGIVIKKVDDHAAEIDESIENPVERVIADSNEPANLEPCVGMEFDSEEAATVFYFAYATRVGFDIRINSRRRSVRDGATIAVQFVCTKEGFRRKECKNKRQQTREGCLAKFLIIKGASGKWTLRKFVKDHCHELFPGEVPVLRSYKLVSTQSDGCGDGCGDSVFTLQGRSRKSIQDHSNCIQNLRERNFGKDAQNVLEYFKHMQTKNASFFYAIQVDKEFRMTNLFWADARSRMAYKYFGDVVTIDITYNQHGIPLVLFLGSNHHKKPMLFGSAQLLDESEISFVWLFNTWLEAMSGCHPISVISNLDRTVEAAVKKVFPSTRRHYCKRDVLKKLSEKLGHVQCKHEDFLRDFSKCISLVELNDEFESCWKIFIDKYELAENEWLQLLYSKREQWVQVFSQDTSSTKMFSRNDITNSFSGVNINAEISLGAFVDQCEKAIDSQYEKEFEEDFKTCYMKPIMKTGLPMEVQAAEAYTRTVFLDFQEQLFQSLHHTSEITNEDGPICTARVVEFGAGKSGYTVTFNSSEVKASCSCQMFEYAGILCRHVLRVFSMKNITMLPSHYILKRWTRNSTSVEIVEQNIAVLDNAQDSWASRFNYLYCQAAKYAGEASSTFNIYHVAMRALRKALQEVDEAKKDGGTVSQISAPVNRNSSEGNNQERCPPDNAVSDVNICDSQQGNTEGSPTTTTNTGNRPAPEEQLKKKRKCQVCKDTNHDKRKCPLLRGARDSSTSNVTSGMPGTHHLHGGTVEQFSLTHIIPGVPTSDYHFLRYV